MIKFTQTITNKELNIAKWAIQAVYEDNDANTYIVIDHRTFTVNETVEEALKLWETTE
jgi:hypothetical protein